MAQAFVRADRLAAWSGGSLLVTTLEGRCDESVRLSGYYFREARFLSRCALTLNGDRPWLCEAAAGSPDQLDFTYVWPEIREYGGGGAGRSGDTVARNKDGIAHRAIEIRLSYEVTHARLLARATFAN